MGGGSRRTLRVMGEGTAQAMKRNQQKRWGNGQNLARRLMKCPLGAGHAQCQENEGSQNLREVGSSQVTHQAPHSRAGMASRRWCWEMILVERLVEQR